MVAAGNLGWVGVDVPIPSMGRTVYLRTTWMVDFYGKLVGKYTVRPMDALGLVGFC